MFSKGNVRCKEVTLSHDFLPWEAWRSPRCYALPLYIYITILLLLSFFFFSLLQCHSLQNIALPSHFAELATKQQVVAGWVVKKIGSAGLSRVTKWRIRIASPPADKPNAAFIYYLRATSLCCRNSLRDSAKTRLFP